VGKWASC
jgi:hypothetical protein